MKSIHTVLTVAVGAALVSLSAQAQTTQGTQATQGASATQGSHSVPRTHATPGTGSGQVDQATPGSHTMPASADGTTRDGRSDAGQGNDSESGLADEDRQFLEDAIEGSYAEIEGSQLALEKSEDPEVRAFAEHMIKDHSQMAKEGSTFATKKGLTPPDGPSAMQVTEITALKALTGGAFDAMYINRIGVASHEATVEMFEEASKNAQDPEVKAMATKTLPKLRDHLEKARAINQKQEKQ